jgi:site-specific recombinase XerD
MLPANPDLPQPRPYDAQLITEFELSIRGRRLSENTIQNNYLPAVTLLARWAAHAGRPQLDEIKRGDLDGWLVWLATEARTRRGQPYQPNYVNNLYRSVQQFFGWLSDVEDIADPTAKMKPPKPEEKLVAVFDDDQVDAILKTVEKGKYHDERRDHAILRLFLCTGVRLAEMTGIRVDDLELKYFRATVYGKGDKNNVVKPRMVKMDPKTAAAISAYLRVRTAHKLAARPELWLGSNHRTPVTPNGLRQIITRRCRQAGLKVNPHMFRHNFSHRFLDNNGQSGDLMELNGWTSPQMVRRYGKSAASARAQRAYDRVDVMGGR